MVLIVSDDLDYSTCEVMDWIHYLGGNAIRINPETKFSFISLLIDDNGNTKLKFVLKDQEYHSDQFKSFWYRRGDINVDHFKINLESLGSHEKQVVVNHLNEEINSLRRTIFNIFESRHSLGTRSHTIDKLTVLKLASKCGFKIPRTYVFTDKKEVRKTFDLQENIITKSIANNLSFFGDEKNMAWWASYTEDVTNEDLDEETNSFPTLIQEKLNKHFEVRVFYIKGSCYSMAIFSQMDSQTKTDFRKYNLKKPNRLVPYCLPIEVEKKITKLMNILSLDTGSLDIVVTKGNEFVFLEINPVGQFGMVSGPCNYKLEKKIAQFLLNKETFRTE